MHTRTGFLGSIVALGLAAAPAGLVPHTANTGVTARCEDVAARVLGEWHVTGTWRALAPFPTPRQASPTLETGVWVERWQLEGGATELRQVSARQTDVVRLDALGCAQGTATYRREYNADSMRGAFTDSSLDSLLRSQPRGMIYVWSPRMPLSVRGLATARAAARDLGISFTAVVAESNAEELSGLGVHQGHVGTAGLSGVSMPRAGTGAGDPLGLDGPRSDVRANSQGRPSADDERPVAWETRRMESLELVYRNATIHYPSVLFYDQGQVIEGVYPGYKSRAAYEEFARRQFAAAAPGPSSAATGAPDTPKMWVDRNARVTTLSTVNTVRRIGFFFKPITGTTLISYTSQDIAYFFDLATGKERRVPGHVDPVPTPDGRFLTLPGLHFYAVQSLLGGNEQPLFTDQDLPDEYQTASILSVTPAALRYRVVTGWNAGARFRDYDVTLAKNGTATAVTPVADPFVPCDERMLTLPINAKSGTEFGAYDAGARTNVVLEVTKAGGCALKLDLGFATGKLSFSYDGGALAFATSRINTTAQGALIRPNEIFHKDALVLFRKTGRIVSLSQNESIGGMTFPEFQQNGTVMLLDQAGPGRPVEQIRVVGLK